MDFHKHPPMMTPLLSAAALMVMGGFLMHRMHPGGIVAALRGERPKPTRTVTIVPSVIPEPDPVAWGEVGVLQVGLEAPPRHATEGPVWMGLRLRHNASGPMGLAVGTKAIPGSGRMVVSVQGSTGKTVEWLVPETDLAFNLTIASGDEVRLPFRYQEPAPASGQTNAVTVTVTLELRDVVIRTEKGALGPLTLASGGIVLTRCWSPDSGAGTGDPVAGDDVLGIRPGDIAIPVPPSSGR